MERTTLFYMANLGSEIQRMFSLQRKGFSIEAQGAYKRACGIIEKLQDSSQFPHRDFEIALMKEYLATSIISENQSGLEKEWQSYFMPFALRQLSLSKII